MKIIYVDDEKILLENFRLTVQGLNGVDSLDTFSDSKEALAWTENNPVDVAFLDIEMPDLLITVDGKLLRFGHTKQEELMALLIDKGEIGITKGEAISCSPDDDYDITCYCDGKFYNIKKKTW